MSFTGGIPMSGQTLGQTRDAVRNNFTNYNNVISLNHVAPNSAGAGKHTMAEFVEQAQAPATSADEVAIYSKQVTYPTPAINSELFLQKEGQAANQPDVQMSRLDKGVLNAQTGYSFLPGGVMIQWGRDAFAGAALAKTVTFPIPFSVACYNVQVLGIGFNNIFHGDTETPTSVIISRNAGTGANQNFWWMAIGN